MDKDSSGSSKTTVIIIASVVVFVVLVAAWYGFMYKPEQEAKEKARQELLAKQEAKKKREEQAAQKKVKYGNMIKKADAQFEQESWEAALSSYSTASSLYPKEPYPQDQLVLVSEKLEEMTAKSVQGTVETISSATGRYYVVVSSSVDGDLAMDYGKKLAAEGNAVKIIEPYRNKRFYRVSLGDYDTLDKAVNASASFSTTNGNVWILKY